MSTSQRSVGSQVVYSSVEVDGDFEGHFRACRPIKKGEVLGVSYMNLGNLTVVKYRKWKVTPGIIKKSYQLGFIH